MSMQMSDLMKHDDSNEDTHRKLAVRYRLYENDLRTNKNEFSIGFLSLANSLSLSLLISLFLSLSLYLSHAHTYTHSYIIVINIARDKQ